MRSLLFILVAAATASGEPAALRSASDACAAELWDLGALRYEQALADRSLEKSRQPEVAMRLAEAWVRGGQPAKALALLKQTYLKSQPEGYFWKALALAASGRLAEAVATLTPALENASLPFRAEALLTRANLLLALEQAPEALLTLKPLAVSKHPALAALAKLRQAEIFLDQQDPKAAREIMPEIANLTPASRLEAALAVARLTLAEDQPQAAVPLFRELLENPDGQTLPHHYAAAIGLADSLNAAGRADEAVKFLLSFIATLPGPSLLGPLFERLLAWLPATLQPDDPILTQLAEWVPPLPPAPPAILNVTGDSVIAAWPTPPDPSPLAPFALHALSAALARVDSPAARGQSASLHSRLLLEYPQHPLAHATLLQDARDLLASQQTAKALDLLDRLRQEPDLMGQADFMMAEATYQHGDPKAAIALYDAAARSLSARAAANARLNAAVLRLHQGLPITTPKPDSSTSLPAGALADLQLEQALAASPPKAARTALESFLLEHPTHPRQAEARLAAAEAALACQPPALEAARAHLEAATTRFPAPADPLPPDRLALARLRLSDLSGQADDTIADAKAFLDTFAKHPAAPDVALLLGRLYYQEGDYNAARMTLEKLVATDPPPARAQVAWLLAARSAALIPTPQSREEALALFDQAIAVKAPLSAIASLEKARLMLDLNHVSEAIAFLRAWIANLPKDDPLQLPAGMLLGEAVTLSAGESPTQLAEALAIYRKLLALPATGPASRHQLKYLCGQLLEQLPDPDNPGTKRIAEAIDTYYSVIESAKDGPPAEWYWFEICGFRAVELYTAAERWQAAIAIARKIASFNGPRAEKAAAQARMLQLKHMVWED